MIEVDLKNKPADLWRLNPYGKVPVLVDGETVIYESAIINEYLEEKYPDIALMPKDPGLRSRVRIWVDFCNTRFHGAGSEILHGSDPEKARGQLRQHYLTVDREMAGKDHIVGAYSLADVTFIPFYVRRERYGVPVDESFPNFRRWMDRLIARPAVWSTL